MRFSKRERFLFTVLILLVLSIIFNYVIHNSVLFVYHHPSTKTSVFKYLTPQIKHIDKVLDIAQNYMGDDYKIRYLYKNYYGSGFLLHNPAPNDLDCSVGVYLGEFDYNGNNSNEVALSVLSKISIFYTAFFETLSNNFS